MNAIEMADNYKKKLEENKRNYIANIVSNDRRSLNDIVDSYITNFNDNRTSSDYKQEYKNQLSKRKNIQKGIQKSTYEKGVQTTVTPFSTQRNILPIQEQSEITKSKKFEITAGQDKLKQNKDVEKKYQDIQQTDEYKKQMKELEEQSNKVGYAKYEYDKQRVAEDDIGWYDKLIGRLVDGAGNLFDYNGGLVKNENGDLMYLPTFNQMKNEKVRNEYDTAIGRFAGDVLYESGKIAGSTLVNQVLPGVGSTMYFGKMFVDSTNQAISEGYDSGSATVYGLINVGLEYATGKMLGSATKGLTGGKTSSYEKLLNKTFSKVIKKPKIASILANAGSEATEEFIQEYLDNINKLIILDKGTDVGSILTDGDILSDALYSAAIGGVTGGVIGTMSGENTNVDNNDVNLYDTFKKELEETKENTTNKDTINKIDTIISSIDSNINNDSNINYNVDTITSQINEYETLKGQNKITKEQEVELNNLKEKLNAIQNQNTDTSTSSKAEVNLPTVQDIVNQEKSSQNSVNLPVYNQQSNITNSDKAILPTANDFSSSNTNMPTSNIKVDMAKIKPEILEDIKGFKLGDPSIESYKGSYIKTMLNEVGIKVPNAMNYVSEVRPDMSFTTTKDLTRQQYASISNALQKLRSVDVTSVNNANYSIPIGNYQYVKSSNANINELRRTASMYLNNTAMSNNTIKLLENIIKDRNYIIRFNPNITNEQGVPVNGLITKENGKTIIELNPNADNYVEFLVIHEITHDIATKEMKELILDYAKQDPEFEKSLESLKERYKTNDVSDEVVADVCGELFGNREFIQSVVEKKPNIFKKILNNIRKLAEKIKGTEANEYVSFVKNLKTMWEDAYYSNRSNLNETKFSIVYNNDGSFNRVKINQNIFENNGGKSISKTIHDYIKEHIGDIYTIIESGQKVYLGKDLPGEYAYSKSTQSLPISNKLAKGIAGYDLQEIIENVTNRKWEKSKHSSHNKDAKYGFYKYDTTFSFDYNGSEKIYTGVVLIRNDANGKKYLYDILNIKPQKKSVNLPSVASNSKMSSARFDGSSNQFTNNIPQSDNNVNSNTSSATKYSIPINKNNTQKLDNSSFSLEKYKQIQLDIIKNNNPVNDDYHTWIRNVEDIKTLEETINDSDWIDYDKYNPDLSRQDIENAIDSGKITVYSSYPIKQGIFVSPSKMEAESYSSNGKVYSKEVNINDVAWIDPTQGQYAKVYNSKYSLPTKEWNDYLKENFPSAGTKTEMSEIKLPVREDISKNIELDYIPQDPTKESTYEEPEKLAEILKEKPTMGNNKDGWLKKLATIKFIDKGYYVDKLARKTKNKELSSKYDYSLSANGIANQIIGNGRFDDKGNKIGKGLYEIFEPIENSGLLDEFSNYIYHKHNVDRMSLQNRFNEANKAIFGDGMTSEMSEKKVSEYETKYPEFEAWANDIYEYNNANLEMLVKYGVLSKENVEYYNKKYPHYVPTIRENSKTKTQMDFLLGKKASVNSPIKKAKGGNGDIIPLKDAMALRTMQTVNSSLRNNFGLELLNTVETEQIRNKENVDNIIEDVNMEELLTKSDNSNSATLTVFENGEKITFDISDEIYEALKPSNIYTIKWLNKFNNIRRGLLTEYNPTFMITNPLKDIQDGSINSKHPETFAKNLIEAGKQIKNKGQYYQLYIANGGSYETYFNYNTGTNIAPSKIDKIAPLKKISEINEEIEMTPRLAEFISSIEAGDSIETAMYNASEITTNFKRGGDITKTLDRNGVTFLNAGVQGTIKQIRNVQEARIEGTRGITKLAVRWTIAGLLPTLLMNMVWGDDDDYEELSDYVKNNYYIIGKYDNGEFIRIPKGRVVSVLQSFFQNVLNGIEGKEIDLKGFADLIENNLLPSDPNESSLIAPIKQAINNETWYGGDLVPTRLQNLPNAEQYDETTDSISIWLGKQLNISPYKINYVLDQYSGAIGDYILPYLTQEAESGNDSFTGKLIAPVKDKFTVDSTLKNQNISDFYSLSEKLTKKSNSSNATDEDILKNKYINSIKSEISKLYAEKREIQSSSSLKDSDKYNQSKELQKQINELSKTALNNYKNIEITDNYAIVGNKEYYKNSNDEWTKIDTESPKYKIANLITKYNNYLKYNDEIKNIKNQYDNSNTRKNAVIKYVNSLNLTIPQKAMLIKMNYSSYTNYDSQIINYINSQEISIDEKTEILEELGFKVRNGKVYTK